MKKIIILTILITILLFGCSRITLVNKNYCESDYDCKTSCWAGWGKNKYMEPTNRTSTGRGQCYNVDFLKFKRLGFDGVCCECEDCQPCGTCRCIDNTCTSVLNTNYSCC